MHYKESKLILEKIKKAKRIALNCHRSPDPDSVGCALALYEALTKFGKDVVVLCPNTISNRLDFLHNYDKILQKVDFGKFNFSGWDLALFCDSANWEMTSDSKVLALPEMEIVNVDHHATNTKFGSINLVVPKASSSSEIVYKLFDDWRKNIDKDIALDLLTGIIGDTGMFRFSNTTAEIIKIVADLMEKGADKNLVVFNLFWRIKPETLKFWSKILENAVVNDELHFVWSAVAYGEFVAFGKPKEGKSEAAELFFQGVENTDFGFILCEEEVGRVFVSFRSRTGIDVSKMAEELGGGGHKVASGVKIEGLTFDKAVEKVLSVARKYAKEYAKSASKGDAF